MKHITASERRRGASKEEAERIGWATVNKLRGGKSEDFVADLGKAADIPYAVMSALSRSNYRLARAEARNHVSRLTHMSSDDHERAYNAHAAAKFRIDLRNRAGKEITDDEFHKRIAHAAMRDAHREMLYPTRRKLSGSTDTEDFALKYDRKVGKSEEAVIDLEKAKLTTRARKKIKSKDFALPGRRYPIHDASHARNALARVSQFGSPEEKTRVRSSVRRKYPGIGKADQIPGGKADDKKPEDFDQDQLHEGAKHEMEHTKDLKLAREIAMDHLVEDPHYYQKLKKVEKAGLVFDLAKAKYVKAPLPGNAPPGQAMHPTGETGAHLMRLAHQNVGDRTSQWRGAVRAHVKATEEASGGMSSGQHEAQARWHRAWQEHHEKEARSNQSPKYAKINDGSPLHPTHSALAQVHESLASAHIQRARQIGAKGVGKSVGIYVDVEKAGEGVGSRGGQVEHFDTQGKPRYVSQEKARSGRVHGNVPYGRFKTGKKTKGKWLGKDKKQKKKAPPPKKGKKTKSKVSSSNRHQIDYEARRRAHLVSVNNDEAGTVKRIEQYDRSERRKNAPHSKVKSFVGIFIDLDRDASFPSLVEKSVAAMDASSTFEELAKTIINVGGTRYMTEPHLPTGSSPKKKKWSPVDASLPTSEMHANAKRVLEGKASEKTLSRRVRRHVGEHFSGLSPEAHLSLAAHHDRLAHAYESNKKRLSSGSGVAFPYGERTLLIHRTFSKVHQEAAHAGLSTNKAASSFLDQLSKADGSGGKKAELSYLRVHQAALLHHMSSVKNGPDHPLTQRAFQALHNAAKLHVSHVASVQGRFEPKSPKGSSTFHDDSRAYASHMLGVHRALHVEHLGRAGAARSAGDAHTAQAHEALSWAHREELSKLGGNHLMAAKVPAASSVSAVSTGASTRKIKKGEEEEKKPPQQYTGSDAKGAALAELKLHHAVVQHHIARLEHGDEHPYTQKTHAAVERAADHIARHYTTNPNRATHETWEHIHGGLAADAKTSGRGVTSKVHRALSVAHEKAKINLLRTHSRKTQEMPAVPAPEKGEGPVVKKASRFVSSGQYEGSDHVGAEISELKLHHAVVNHRMAQLKHGVKSAQAAKAHEEVQRAATHMAYSYTSSQVPGPNTSADHQMWGYTHQKHADGERANNNHIGAGVHEALAHAHENLSRQTGMSRKVGKSVKPLEENEMGKMHDLFKSEIGNEMAEEKAIIDCPHCDEPITKSQIVGKALREKPDLKKADSSVKIKKADADADADTDADDDASVGEGVAVDEVALMKGIMAPEVVAGSPFFTWVDSGLDRYTADLISKGDNGTALRPVPPIDKLFRQR